MNMTSLDRKRVLNIFLWAVVAALAVRLAYKSIGPGAVRAGSSAYTVVRAEKAFDKSGNLVYTNEYLDALRSDGAVAYRFTSQVARTRRIAFPNGSGIVINELIAKKSTYPRKFTGIRIARDPNTSCSSEADAKVGIALEGTDTIGGYRTFRFGQVGSQGTWKGWYAPDLGCALLQMRLEHDTGVTEQQLSSVTLGEPDPALFQVQDNIQETVPSGLYPPLCRNGNCEGIADAVKARMDKSYMDKRSTQP
jgi:hypothetical protein